LGFQNLTSALSSVIKELESTRTRDAVAAAANFYAAIQNRNIQRGTDSQGRPYPQYSTNQARKSLFYGKGRNAGANARLRSFKGGTISYEQFRKLNNLQTNHRDHFFTGRMWRETGVTNPIILPDSVLISITGKTRYAKELLGKNNIRLNTNILEPTQNEIDTIKRMWAASRAAKLKF